MFSNKNSHILKRLIVYVSTYDLFLPTSIKGLKNIFAQSLVLNESKCLAFRQRF